MGKKAKPMNDLGRALTRDKYGKKNKISGSMFHTTELEDGQNWNRINFQSITEQSQVDEFLATAELAGTEFQAEKLNVQLVKPSSKLGIVSDDEKIKIHEAQDANRSLLRIPRRPMWNVITTAEELAEAERRSFLDWRRGLAHLEEVEGITLTPYEKNIEFWRQLWRVIERSDVVVQIVDARNPLLFRCEDLESYVQEVNPNKDNLLLVNKADFLSEEQRKNWARYFQKKGIQATFFSALSEEELSPIPEDSEDFKECNTMLNAITKEGSDTDNVIDNLEECRQDLESLTTLFSNSKIAYSEDECQRESSKQGTCTDQECTNMSRDTCSFINSTKILTRSELVELFKTFHKKNMVSERYITIGLVGYPNVGKSSTINTLLQKKKVSVSATPGKTKHFQTLFLSEDILLCDCPGLIFPAFVLTKEDMIVSGILPIDQMRDHVPPTNLIAHRIPRNVFENIYGIAIPKPGEGEDASRPPTAEELLNSYGYMRGFMTSNGQPDNPRSSRYILKDYVKGKLLYCHAPPDFSQSDYHQFNCAKEAEKYFPKQQPTPQQVRIQPHRPSAEALDKNFFSNLNGGAHFKGKKPITGLRTQATDLGAGESVSKPWKKHNNKNRKEKLRRKFAGVDPYA
ncbi:nucleostemin 3 isoform X2 [Oratosquilla oratoria]|uniref:nucleostemin 3 isoform X2 n=1 Tax=Oratosquilla oratoria TaxID=337810 RepID=UPI003F766344